MTWVIVGVLLVLAILLMVAELKGAPVVLVLDFKRDLKRESRWLAQYGQAACTLSVAALIYLLDHRRFKHHLAPAHLLLIVVFGAGVIGMILKRLFGRVRPGRENAGKFLGPTWQHASGRESFPSSHSAAAFAMSMLLARLYPQGAMLFWALALICAVLRYLMDAHWPSDVLAGIALGLAVSAVTIHVMGI